jgi:hypothetical protein
MAAVSTTVEANDRKANSASQRIDSHSNEIGWYLQSVRKEGGMVGARGLEMYSFQRVVLPCQLEGEDHGPHE